MKARLKSSREAFCRRAPSSNSGENCWIKARSRNFAACSKLDSEKQGSLGKQPISGLKRRFTTVSNWAALLLAILELGFFYTHSGSRKQYGKAKAEQPIIK